MQGCCRSASRRLHLPVSKHGCVVSCASVSAQTPTHNNTIKAHACAAAAAAAAAACITFEAGVDQRLHALRVDALLLRIVPIPAPAARVSCSTSHVTRHVTHALSNVKALSLPRTTCLLLRHVMHRVCVCFCVCVCVFMRFCVCMYVTCLSLRDVMHDAACSSFSRGSRGRTRTATRTLQMCYRMPELRAFPNFCVVG